MNGGKRPRAGRKAVKIDLAELEKPVLVTLLFNDRASRATSAQSRILMASIGTLPSHKYSGDFLSGQEFLTALRPVRASKF